MNDYMDGLVKEVEGNMKPIRAEKMEDYPETGNPGPASPAPAAPAKPEKDLFLHVHRENVKCYRNTQAVIVENADTIKQEMEKRISRMQGWFTGLLILGILNLGAVAFLILHIYFGLI